MTAEEWVSQLGLIEHPEGGWFRETYRSSESISQENLPMRFSGDRSFGTAIYFLLTSDHFSSLHRIQSDEIWHFYAGSHLTVHVINKDGGYEKILLGEHNNSGVFFQAVVEAGSWFGATVDTPNTYALVGCTVAPGFDFADFELGDRGALLAEYPQHKALIERLTR